MANHVTIPAAHRLVLSRAEWSVLADQSPIELPPDLRPPGGLRSSTEPSLGLTSEERRAAARHLVDRGVLTERGSDPLRYPPVRSVAANLALLVAHRVGVRIDVGIGRYGVRAAYVLTEAVGASLFTLADGAVELSMFPAARWGWELVRAVPTSEQLETSGVRIRRALRSEEDTPLTGLVPLAALARATPEGPPWAASFVDDIDGLPDLDDDERALARAAAARTVGLLRCLVAGRVGDGTGLGQVVWLAADDGWVGAAPDLPDRGRPMVRLMPVSREDLPTWVAPYVAQILEATSD